MKKFLIVFATLAAASAYAQDEDAPEAAPETAPAEAPASEAPEAPATVVDPAAEVPAGSAEPVSPPPGEVTIAVKRHLIATGIEANEPVGVAETFSAAAAPQVSCFMELVNPTRGELKIQVKWSRNEGHVYTQPIRLLPGPTTRTWARMKLNAQRTGAWRCDVETEAGAPISTARFQVEP